MRTSPQMWSFSTVSSFDSCPVSASTKSSTGRTHQTLLRWTPQNRPFRAWRLRLVEFYLVASVVRKSDWIFVRQLRGPHLRTWP